MMLGIFGAAPKVMNLVLQTVRFLVYIFVTLYFIKDVLDRDFGTFRVGVVPHPKTLPVDGTSPTK